MNPFREKATRARTEANRLNGTDARDAAMARSFPLGAGYGHGSVRSRERRMDARIDRAVSAVKARELAEYLEAQADAYDAGRINTQGRAVRTESSVSTQASIADYLRATLKPGDQVSIGGNSALTVARVNARGITSEGGSRWSYSEITPAPNGVPMTTPEFFAAYRAWKQAAQ